MLYEIRRDGETVCRSSLPRCGYCAQRLKEMIASGYRYYIDGKLQRRLEAGNGEAD